MRKKHWLWVALISFFATLGFSLTEAEHIVAKRLQKLLLKQDNEFYKYELGEFDFRFFSRELILKQVKISPKIEYLDSLKRRGEAKSSVYAIELGEIIVQDLDPISVLFSTHIDIAKIQFGSPTINLFKADSSIAEEDQIDSRIKDQKRFFSDIVDGKFRSIKIGEIAIENARSSYYKVYKNDTMLQMRSDTASFKIFGIETDQALLKSKKVFNYDSSSFDLKGTYWEGHADYRILLGEFKKTSNNDNLILKNISIGPREDKFTFMIDQAEEIDWYKCSIDEVEVRDFDFSAFQRDNSFKSKHIIINNADLEIYRDKRLRDQNSIKPLIGSIIKDLKVNVSIDQLAITESAIDYYEWEEDAKAPIHAQLDSLRIEIENLNNEFKKEVFGDTLKLKLMANFMKKGKLNIHAKFYLADHNDRFSLLAQLEEIPLSALNPVLKESAFIAFSDGKLDWLEMEMQANDEVSESRMDLQYSGMKHFDILRGMNEMKVKREKGNQVSRKRKFLSFILRGILPNDYGPESNNYQTARYSVRRDRNKSIVNYLVENLKSGAKAHLEPQMLKKSD